MPEQPRFCTFYVGRHLIGIDAAEVQEIVPARPMTPLPLAPAPIRGLINLRGRIVVAIDIRRWLELSSSAAEMDCEHIVLRANDGDASLLVDRVGDVVEVEQSEFEPVPEPLLRGPREYLQGAYKLRGGLLLVLDVGKAIGAIAGRENEEQ